MKSKKKAILRMYFNQKLKPTDIAKELNISKSAVTQALQTDKRYIGNKLKRKSVNENKHKEYVREYIKNKRQIKKSKNSADDLILKNMHNQASMEMSKGKKLSNMAYRNWNVSAFSYNDKKRRYEFKEKELGRSHDVPKYIKVEV